LSVCPNRNKNRSVSFGIDRFILDTLALSGISVHQGLCLRCARVKSGNPTKSSDGTVELFLVMFKVSGHISLKVGERMASHTRLVLVWNEDFTRKNFASRAGQRSEGNC
jgi:hypothetical protein